MYAVFGRRQGRVLGADSAGFGGQFRVLAVLPVPESFHLASELRTQTSGLASPQLVFSHWEGPASGAKKHACDDFTPSHEHQQHRPMNIRWYIT
uniref:Elongation factor EFG domain-containing protein n=1 Tax=Trichogramma kaykai TaxID=54128 RepID=A0ABD2XCL1_9HYME